jgi:hypothetical protein
VLFGFFTIVIPEGLNRGSRDSEDSSMAKGYLIKRNGVYYGRYLDPNGIEKKKSLKTNNKEIAQAKLAKLIEQIERQEIGWDVKEKSAEEYLQEYLTYC